MTLATGRTQERIEPMDTNRYHIMYTQSAATRVLY